jgi:hypothetical protein
VVADLRITWTLAGRGWADCTVATKTATVELTASYISSAPEDLLTAVARLVAGETQTRAQFEAEPTAFRWIFYRDGDDAWLRLLELRDGRGHDNAGIELLSGPLSVDGLARAVVRCFDEVATVHGESGYPRRVASALSSARARCPQAYLEGSPSHQRSIIRAWHLRSAAMAICGQRSDEVPTRSGSTTVSSNPRRRRWHGTEFVCYVS